MADYLLCWSSLGPRPILWPEQYLLSFSLKGVSFDHNTASAARGSNQVTNLENSTENRS